MKKLTRLAMSLGTCVGLSWSGLASTFNSQPSTFNSQPSTFNSQPSTLFVGTSGLGHVSPAACYPFGAVQAGPDTSSNPTNYVADWAHTSGYQHQDAYLWRFSQNRFMGIGCGTLGLVGLLPGVGPFAGANACAEMDKATEVAEPGYYAVTLKDGIRCEVAALAHSAAYRFTRTPNPPPSTPNPQPSTPNLQPSTSFKLIVDADWGVWPPKSPTCFGRCVYDGAVCLSPSTEARVHCRQLAWNEVECWAVLAFSSPVVGTRLLKDSDGKNGEVWEYDFGEIPDGVLEVRLGVSSRSVGGAERNLAAEIPSFDFDGVRRASASGWAAYLDRIRLDEATPERVRRNFEAAYYRTLVHPSDLGDVDAPAHSNMSLWDIFRACAPLQTIVAPDKTAEIVRSIVDIYERQGYLPILHAGGAENHCMVGHHAVPIVVDNILKGIVTNETDVARAYAAVKDSLTRSHVKANDATWGLLKEDWDILDRYGYYPFDAMRGAFRGKKVLGESVSRTLECAYDDACAAKLAAALGHKDDAAFFSKRAANWRNVYDPSTGFMRGRAADGSWRTPFDPKSCGAGPWADNDFTEGNSWQYTWHVMHDVDGLVAAMGGKTAFGDKLDALFSASSEVYGPSFVNDVSGLVGQYAHGNEPSHHVAYLYRRSDRPWRTDETVRRICETMYSPTPDGLCGNDDSGQMAAWYVFSALGFYPVDACGGTYVLGAPQVPGATLALPNGKALRIVAKDFGPTNGRVLAVTLNGRPVENWEVRHVDILAGGTLEFAMGNAWTGSEWLSAAGAPVVTNVVGFGATAAPGTSWFVGKVANPGEIVSARWMTAGLGVYELYVNGRRVGDDFLKPGFTHYAKTKYAFAYDVTDLLKRKAGDENQLAAEVSSGWWRDKIVTPDGHEGFRGRKSAFRAILELTLKDGSRVAYGTNPRDWKAGVGGPVKRAAIYDGEFYDARAASDLALGVPEVNAEFAGEILPTDGAEVLLRHDLTLAPVAAYVWQGVEGATEEAYGKVRVVRTLDPKGALALRPGETLVVDFGQNAAAVPAFRFSAPRDTVLTVRPGEVLNEGNGEKARNNDGPAGSVLRNNLGDDHPTARLAEYTFAGKGVEDYMPRFTYFGYRYLSLTATAPVEIASVVSVPVSSIRAEDEVGRIEVGEPALQKFLDNVRWTQRSNFLSVPTDCPQRWERLGWLGDARIFADAACYGADVRKFFGKFMRDVRDSQSADGGFASVAPTSRVGSDTFSFGWADAGVVIPWTVWQHCGERRILEENWSAMSRFVRRLDETKYDFEGVNDYIWSDWLSFERYESCGNEYGNWKKWKDDPDAKAYRRFLAACFWLYDARLMAQMADALDKPDEAAFFRVSADRALKHIRGSFLEKDGGLLAAFRDLQTACVFALHLGVASGEARVRTRETLVGSLRRHGSLRTGILGTCFLMETLAEEGAWDVAYDLLLSRKMPSWLYSTTQGATTVWERWNGYTPEKGYEYPGMNSFSHYAYGAVSAWVWRHAAGIATDPKAAGFRRIRLAPHPDRRLGRLAAELRVPAGVVKSAWRFEGDWWIWNFTVPEGTTAHVTLPGDASGRDYAAGTYEMKRWEGIGK